MFESLENFFKPKPRSAAVAKNRLQLQLTKERIGLSESQFSQLKQDLCNVLSKYFEIDDDSLVVDILRQDGKPALSVNTPVNTPVNSALSR